MYWFEHSIEDMVKRAAEPAGNKPPQPTHSELLADKWSSPDTSAPDVQATPHAQPATTTAPTTAAGVGGTSVQATPAVANNNMQFGLSDSVKDSLSHSPPKPVVSQADINAVPYEQLSTSTAKGNLTYDQRNAAKNNAYETARVAPAAANGRAETGIPGQQYFANGTAIGAELKQEQVERDQRHAAAVQASAAANKKQNIDAANAAGNGGYVQGNGTLNIPDKDLVNMARTGQGGTWRGGKFYPTGSRFGYTQNELDRMYWNMPNAQAGGEPRPLQPVVQQQPPAVQQTPVVQPMQTTAADQEGGQPRQPSTIIQTRSTPRSTTAATDTQPSQKVNTEQAGNNTDEKPVGAAAADGSVAPGVDAAAAAATGTEAASDGAQRSRQQPHSPVAFAYRTVVQNKPEPPQSPVNPPRYWWSDLTRDDVINRLPFDQVERLWASRKAKELEPDMWLAADQMRSYLMQHPVNRWWRSINAPSASQREDQTSAAPGRPTEFYRPGFQPPRQVNL